MAARWAKRRTSLHGRPHRLSHQAEARYYIALADFQSGDFKQALAGWQSLLAESHADAGWIEPTRARIGRRGPPLGLDPAKEPGSAAAVAAQSCRRLHRQHDAGTAAGHDPRHGLDSRRQLEANPDNPTGWRQLARAYTVLGQEDKAKEALARAAQARAEGGAKP